MISAKNNSKLRIAAFGGFRSIPPKAGGAGADKFAMELYPRIIKQGHSVVAYVRIYLGELVDNNHEYEGIKLISFTTVNKAGFDSLIHSFKATFDIIIHNRADVVHIMSGANSLWSIFLRLAGKKVIVSQFAMDWKRDKWPWYGKLYYIVSNYLTAYLPHKVAFDNIYTKDYFEKKFNKQFDFIPYGCEVKEPSNNNAILSKLDLAEGEYFLFVGRFIPDKGIHLLIDAFKKVSTNKKLVLVGGAPNPSNYEMQIKTVQDKRMIFPGYIYGTETNTLIKKAFAYVQPSIIEGLSPILLTVMGLGTPIICSDIIENKYITKDNAIHFSSGNVPSLIEKLEYSLSNYNELLHKAKEGKEDVKKRFSWERITDEFIKIFSE